MDSVGCGPSFRFMWAVVPFDVGPPVAEPQSMAALLGDFPGCMYETDGREATGRCSNGSGADQDTPDAA